MLMIILAFLAGFGLSATAAYYSIIGLMAIFPGSPVAIITMGVTLEFAKLVAASWIYRNWKISPFPMKFYMVSAVLVLMFITSMGIFGFLSKSHLEHSIMAGADTVYQIESLNSKIESKERTVAILDKQLANMDEALAKSIELGYVTKGLAQREELNSERGGLENQREALEEELVNLKSNRNALTIEEKKIAVDVGPLKYIAELVFGEDNAPSKFDETVRWVILLIVFVFDPFAIALLLAANVSLIHRVKTPKRIDAKEKIVYNASNEILKDTFEEKEKPEVIVELELEDEPSPIELEEDEPPSQIEIDSFETLSEQLKKDERLRAEKERSEQYIK